VALADTAVVERDHPIPGGESGHLKRPRRLIAAKPHDQHERLTLAHTLVKHLDVTDPHPRHQEPYVRRGERLDVSGAERGEREGLVSLVEVRPQGTARRRPG